MKIWVTGHKGFIGSRVYEALKLTDHDVKGFDSGVGGEEWRRDYDSFLEPQFSFADLVIHCGAVADTWASGKRLWGLNYQATHRLAWDVSSRGAKMIFLSSCSANDPLNEYGWSKRVCENCIYDLFHNVGDRVCVLRLYNVWDIDEDDRRFKSIVYKIIHNDLQAVYLDCWRDFVLRYDVVKAIVSLVDNFQPGMWEIGTGVGTEILELVRMAHQIEPLISDLGTCLCPENVPLSTVANPDNILRFEGDGFRGILGGDGMGESPLKTAIDFSPLLIGASAVSPSL